MGLIIKRIDGAAIEEVAEGAYRLSHTPAFTALGERPRLKDESDPRLVAVCDLAFALFKEISSLERLKRYQTRPDEHEHGLPDVLPVLLVNAVMHGNQYDPHKHVGIEYSFDELGNGNGRFNLTVRDQGPGFDYVTLARAEREARRTAKTFNDYRSREERPASSVGLGLFELIRYVRSIRWNQPGNEVMITKDLRPIELRRMTPRPYA